MFMKKIITMSIALGVASMAIPLSAPAHASGADAVEYRQQAFKMIRANFGQISDMVRGQAEFDADAVRTRANALKHLSHIPFDAFTGAGYRVTENSDTLPAAWDNWDDFQSKAEAFQKAAYELAEAAESGDARTIRPRFMATARTCQQCHEDYRAD